MLKLVNVSHQYTKTLVLDQINLEVAGGEIMCLLGASGSGKTTLLRIIAGLEADHTGAVYIADQNVKALPVHRRDVGMVFQDFALFPHLTVEQNIAFGLRMREVPQKIRIKRVAHMLDLVGLQHLAARSIDQLSGGEQQRVALARALAPEPALLLLDEPLGALDAGLKEQLTADLRQIIKSLHLTAIYVTHDQEEAYAVADRIAILYEGRLAQVDDPETLFRQPKTAYVAQFLGLGNVIVAGQVPHLSPEFRADTQVLVHPLGIRIAEGGSIFATIAQLIYRGDHYQVIAQLNNGQHLRFKQALATSASLYEGLRVTLHIDPAQVIQLER